MANHEGFSGEVNTNLRTGALELIKIYFNHRHILDVFLAVHYELTVY